jgi:L-alanine-DL-glutamate epimerase-like enolase superfamily enzyme
VPVNATIGAVDDDRAAAQARAAAEAGFRCLKLKVGTEGDGARVAAVRAAVGPDVAIRVDANGAWAVDRAAEELDRLSGERLELAEEPVRGVQAFRDLRRAIEGRVGIAMDETALEPGAVASGAADAICLKIATCGGITPLLEAAAAARAAGTEVYLASAFDGPVGVAAALHAAGALGIERPCGLATLGLFADCPNPFPVRGGCIALPTAPGLGAR